MALKLWLSAGAFVALMTHVVLLYILYRTTIFQQSSIFSSPELKAQVSYSDSRLSV
jgi:hypothetical protein